MRMFITLIIGFFSSISIVSQNVHFKQNELSSIQTKLNDLFITLSPPQGCKLHEWEKKKKDDELKIKVTAVDIKHLDSVLYAAIYRPNSYRFDTLDSRRFVGKYIILRCIMPEYTLAPYYKDKKKYRYYFNGSEHLTVILPTKMNDKIVYIRKDTKRMGAHYHSMHFEKSDDNWDSIRKHIIQRINQCTK